MTKYIHILLIPNYFMNFNQDLEVFFSTDTCLIHLTNCIRFEMDKCNMVGMLLLDLQKAFDTVDHSILLMKLEASGLDNDILFLFKSYLSDRTHLVDFLGHTHRVLPSPVVSAQDSILGPLLFLVYVNDSRILMSGKNKQCIESKS